MPAVVEPSALAVPAGDDACGGCLPPCESGLRESAQGVGGGLAGPVFGTPTRPWRRPRPAGRHTTALAPACRGRLPPPLPVLARWQRSGLAGVPVDANAPPHTGVPPRRPVRRAPRPRPGGSRCAPASGEALRPASVRASLPRGAPRVAAAPSLPARGGRHQSVGRTSRERPWARDTRPGSGDSRPYARPHSPAPPRRPRRDTPRSPRACLHDPGDGHRAPRGVGGGRHRPCPQDCGAPV
jgi:hypothetical protein